MVSTRIDDVLLVSCCAGPDLECCCSQQCLPWPVSPTGPACTQRTRRRSQVSLRLMPGPFIPSLDSLLALGAALAAGHAILHACVRLKSPAAQSQLVHHLLSATFSYGDWLHDIWVSPIALGTHPVIFIFLADPVQFNPSPTPGSLCPTCLATFPAAGATAAWNWTCPPSC